MRTLKNVLGALAGLFVDDGEFALAVLAVVAGTAFVAVWVPNGAGFAGILLLAGCLGVLIGSVIGARHRVSPPSPLTGEGK